MKLVDANVLLHAVNEDSPNHEEARRWLDRALTGREPVGLPWIVLLAFLRLSTRSDLFPRPLDIATAGAVVEAWLAQPAALPVDPTQRHLALMLGFLAGTGTAANLVNDAHLAALAVEHGAAIVSYDRDFGRFEGIAVEQPGG